MINDEENIRNEIDRINKALDFNNRYKVLFMVTEKFVTIVSRDGFYSRTLIEVMNELGYTPTAFVTTTENHYAQFER